MDRFLMIAVGAAAGGMLRYVVGSAITQRFGGHFPWGTMIVNVSGCFLIGVIMTILERTGANPRWGLLLVTGLLGGYTTFSSFGFETYVLIREGFLTRALSYATGSVIAGCLAVWCGVAIARVH